MSFLELEPYSIWNVCFYLLLIFKHSASPRGSFRYAPRPIRINFQRPVPRFPLPVANMLQFGHSSTHRKTCDMSDLQRANNPRKNLDRILVYPKRSKTSARTVSIRASSFKYKISVQDVKNLGIGIATNLLEFKATTHVYYDYRYHYAQRSIRRPHLVPQEISFNVTSRSALCINDYS